MAKNKQITVLKETVRVQRIEKNDVTIQRKSEKSRKKA